MSSISNNKFNPPHYSLIKEDPLNGAQKAKIRDFVQAHLLYPNNFKNRFLKLFGYTLKNDFVQLCNRVKKAVSPALNPVVIPLPPIQKLSIEEQMKPYVQLAREGKLNPFRLFEIEKDLIRKNF